MTGKMVAAFFLIGFVLAGSLMAVTDLLGLGPTRTTVLGQMDQVVCPCNR